MTGGVSYMTGGGSYMTGGLLHDWWGSYMTGGAQRRLEMV